MRKKRRTKEKSEGMILCRKGADAVLIDKHVMHICLYSNGSLVLQTDIEMTYLTFSIS